MIDSLGKMSDEMSSGYRENNDKNAKIVLTMPNTSYTHNQPA